MDSVAILPEFIHTTYEGLFPNMTFHNMTEYDGILDGIGDFMDHLEIPAMAEKIVGVIYIAREWKIDFEQRDFKTGISEFFTVLCFVGLMANFLVIGVLLLNNNSLKGIG